MSATPADDVQTSPAWNCGCKGTKKNAYAQVLCDFFLFSGRAFGATV